MRRLVNYDHLFSKKTGLVKKLAKAGPHRWYAYSSIQSQWYNQSSANTESCGAVFRALNLDGQNHDGFAGLWVVCIDAPCFVDTVKYPCT